MAQVFEDDFGGCIANRLMHVDVRAPRNYSREVTELEREQGRIDWRVRNQANMEKIKKHEVTPIYEK